MKLQKENTSDKSCLSWW